MQQNNYSPIDNAIANIKGIFSKFLAEEKNFVEKVVARYNTEWKEISILERILIYEDSITVKADGTFTHVNFKIGGQTFYDFKKIIDPEMIENLNNEEARNCIQVVKHDGNCYREAMAIEVFFGIFLHTCDKLGICDKERKDIFKDIYTETFKKEVIIPGYDDVNQKFLIFLLLCAMDISDKSIASLRDNFYEQIYNYIVYAVLENIKAITKHDQNIEISINLVKKIILSFYSRIQIKFHNTEKAADACQSLTRHIDNIPNLLKDLPNEKNEALEREVEILETVARNLRLSDINPTISINNIKNQKYISNGDYLVGDGYLVRDGYLVGDDGISSPMNEADFKIVKIKKIKGKFYLYSIGKKTKCKGEVFCLKNKEEVEKYINDNSNFFEQYTTAENHYYDEWIERYELLTERGKKNVSPTLKAREWIKNYNKFTEPINDEEIIEIFENLDQPSQSYSLESNPHFFSTVNAGEFDTIFEELFEDRNLIHITQKQSVKVFTGKKEELSLLELRFSVMFGKKCQERKLKTSDGKSLRSGDFFSFFNGKDEAEKRENMRAYIRVQFARRDEKRGEVYEARMKEFYKAERCRGIKE